MDNRNLNKKLKEILGLTTLPVAIKIIRANEPLPNIKEPPQKSRYCQLLMLAKKGQTLMLTAENIACHAAKAALGFGPLPEKIATGEMLCTLGFGSKFVASSGCPYEVVADYF